MWNNREEIKEENIRNWWWGIEDWLHSHHGGLHNPQSKYPTSSPPYLL